MAEDRRRAKVEIIDSTGKVVREDYVHVDNVWYEDLVGGVPFARYDLSGLSLQDGDTLRLSDLIE